jgi:hypothetical protein
MNKYSCILKADALQITPETRVQICEQKAGKNVAKQAIALERYRHYRRAVSVNQTMRKQKHQTRHGGFHST